MVGIVGRVKQYALDSDSRIAYYVPQKQYPVRAMNVVIRSQSDPSPLEFRRSQRHPPNGPRSSSLQRAYHAATPGRFTGPTPLLHDADFILRSFALAPGKVGTYGVISYLVTQGTQGDRHQNGAWIHASRNHSTDPAKRHDVSLAWASCIGTVYRAGGNPLYAQPFVWRQRSRPAYLCRDCGLADPITLLAISIPARRASQTDPMMSLRAE